MSIVKTQAGQRVMKDRSVPLTPRQRSAFILFDGRKTVADVLNATAAVGVTSADIDHLLALGLLAHAEPASPPTEQADVADAVAAAPTQPAAPGTPQERYAAAYPLAIKLTSSLGLRGFRLNLAVEAAGRYDDLVALAPKIRDAVGAEKYAPLGQVLDA